MMKNKYTSLLIGGIIVFVTLLIFFVTKSKTAIDYVALVFIVFAEAACVGVYFTSKQTSGYSTLTLTAIMVVYVIVSILFSVNFARMFSDNIAKFATINIVFIAIAAISIIVANRIVSKVEKNEKNCIEQAEIIQECENRALILSNDEKLAPYQDMLTKIYEEIKYNDKISGYKSGEILAILNEIAKKKDETNLPVLCQKAMQLINERNIVVKASKRGGF